MRRSSGGLRARSVTDCGIGAEVDELRVRFAERSKVQKEIAKRNLEEQNTKLRRIGALGDAASEAPLGGRPKKNVEQQREEEMARLREQNEVMRLRISEYKGFIDRSDRKEETWLAWLFPCAPAPVEKVEWGMDGRRGGSPSRSVERGDGRGVCGSEARKFSGQSFMYYETSTPESSAIVDACRHSVASCSGV